MQIRSSPDSAQQTPPVELRGHRHRVRGLAATVEVEDRVIDALVVGSVEVAGPQALEDVGDGVLTQQHSAEHGLFGGFVLRRLAAEVFGGWWDVVDARATAIVHDSHGVLTSPHTGRTYVRWHYRDCKRGPRQTQPPRRRNDLATGNARRCWRDRKGGLFMNLWMGCGYLRSAVLRRWGEPVDGRRRLPHPCR